MLTRTTHYIKHNLRCTYPQNILCVDTETRIEDIDADTQHQTFRLGYAIFNIKKHNKQIRKEFPLYSINDFHNILDTVFRASHTKLQIFSHNSAFDYSVLKMDTYLSSRNFKINRLMLKNVFVVSAYRDSDGCSLTYSDTMNYYHLSLEELGKIFANRKMTKPDFKNISDEKLMEYCKQDTKVLETIALGYIDFIKKHDLGNFKDTLAGQAFTAYRHRFMDKKILVHTFSNILVLELESYRGGRCEAFRLGKFKNVYKLDVNSMYPFVMRTESYPIEPRQKEVITDIDMSVFSKNDFILADCLFNIESPAIGVRRDKLIFPIGRIRQTLINPEIRYLADNPDICKSLRFAKAVTYKQADIFSKYIDYFYSIKRNAPNDAERFMAKLFMNALYGKFGQRTYPKPELITDENTKRWLKIAMDEFETHALDDLTGGEKFSYIRLGQDYYLLKKPTEKLSYDSCPIIASSVTAYARMYLWKLINIAGFQNVLYCDTDSLFVLEDGFENLQNAGLISDTELGKLKLEETGDVRLFNAKHYRFNDILKIKGIRKDAVKLNENTYEQSQFETRKIRYRNGTPDGIVVVRQIKKTISKDYTKGKVEGTFIKPLILNDW